MRDMLERGKNERGVIEMVDTESLVPPGHLLRQVDAAVDFEKLYKIVEPLYSEEEGRRSIQWIFFLPPSAPVTPCVDNCNAYDGLTKEVKHIYDVFPICFCPRHK